MYETSVRVCVEREREREREERERIYHHMYTAVCINFGEQLCVPLTVEHIAVPQNRYTYTES